MFNPDEGRPIRVFISSTFLDMQVERDIIVNVVFPNLRRRFRSAGREIVDVDLRWGVTEDQARRGETAGLCLAEIDRCRPFFIGMVGDRYGWAPNREEFPTALTEAYPVLSARSGRSLTEIEFDYGPLSAPARAEHAFFLLRAPSLFDSVFDLQAEALKQRVRASGLPYLEYVDPAEIAEPLEQALGEAIGRRITQNEEMLAHVHPADRLHEAYAAERQRHYQGAQRRNAPLDAWIDGEGGPLLLVEGASGSGKSALIANWTAHNARRRPGDLTIAHFLAANEESAAPNAMLQRLVRLIEAAVGGAQTGQTEGPALIQRFHETLRRGGMAAAERGGRLVLALDGLDKLTEWDDLRWLAKSLPEHVAVLASALPGRAHAELIDRQIARHSVAPFGESEARAYVEERLGHFAKSLSAPQLERIVAAPFANTPIALQTIVNELRVFGHYHELDAQIGYYLSADDIPDLFDRVLSRIEEACGATLVSATLPLICLARNGIEERALREMAGASKLELAAILLRLGDALWEHGGRINFAHDHARQAVTRRYLPEAQQEIAVRTGLADHFDPRRDEDPGWAEYLELSTGESWLRTERRRTPEERQELMLQSVERLRAAGKLDQHVGAKNGVLHHFILTYEEPPLPRDLGRLMEEWPYQLMRAGRREALRELLTDLRWFNALCDRGQTELQNYWRAAGLTGEAAEYELCEMINVHMPEHGKWTRRQHRTVWRVMNFLKQAGWAGRKSLEIMRKHTELAIAVRGNAHPASMSSLRDLAAFESWIGMKESVVSTLKEVVDNHDGMLGEEHPQALLSKTDYAIALNNAGRAEEARTILEDIRPKISAIFGVDARETLSATIALANTLHDLEEVARAQELREEALEISQRALGADDPTTLELMSGLGIGFRRLRQADEACRMHARVLERRSAVLGPEHPATLATQTAYGLALLDAGKLDEAKSHLSVGLALASAGPDGASTARSAREGLATIAARTGEMNAALELEAEIAADAQANAKAQPAEAVTAMVAYGAALQAFGRLEEAKTWFECAVEIAAAAGRPLASSLAMAKGALARALVAQRQLPQARALLEEVLAEHIEANGGVQKGALGDIGLLLRVLLELGQPERALALAQSVPEQAMADAEDAFDCRFCAALALHALGRYEEAIGAFRDLFNASSEADPRLSEVFLRYAQSCYADGQVERTREAEAILLSQWGGVPDEPREEKLASLMRIGEMGRLQFSRGDYEAAEPTYRFILENEQRLFGKDSPQAKQTSSNLAVVESKRAASNTPPAPRGCKDRVRRIVEQVLGGEITAPSGMYALVPLLASIMMDEALNSVLTEVLRERTPALDLQQMPANKVVLILDAMAAAGLFQIPVEHAADKAGDDSPGRRR